MGRKHVVFQPNDWVWVHMPKERFPAHRKSKLQVILVLLVRESIFVGWGFLFSIVLVPRYKLYLGTSYLCVTLLSNLIYLAFRALVSFRVGRVTMWSQGSHQGILIEYASWGDEKCAACWHPICPYILWIERSCGHRWRLNYKCLTTCLKGSYLSHSQEPKTFKEKSLLN
jgi:hypothetical protein